jgi:hypothetical protein
MGVDQRAETFHLDLVAVDTRLVEAEATQVIGAGRDAGTESRVTERNGRRSKTLATKAADIGIGIPKLRKAASSSILEPRRRIDQALHRDRDPPVGRVLSRGGVADRAATDAYLDARNVPRTLCP